MNTRADQSLEVSSHGHGDEPDGNSARFSCRDVSEGSITCGGVEICTYLSLPCLSKILRDEIYLVGRLGFQSAVRLSRGAGVGFAGLGEGLRVDPLGRKIDKIR